MLIIDFKSPCANGKKIEIKQLTCLISTNFKATTRFELVIRVLQTRALPLGYVAIFNYEVVILQ
jgi:hypothetical protein